MNFVLEQEISGDEKSMPIIQIDRNDDWISAAMIY